MGSDIVNVRNAKGPGVNAQLIGKLNSWGIETLTKIQALALDAGVADGQSIVVSAPTSSGKTLVGEIAVLSALSQGIRALYLVSHKALADQKYKDFNNRFGENAAEPIATVSLNTGDRTEGDIDAQLIVATYEKALGLFVAGQIKVNDTLVVADELQILGDPSRGPDIEALCAALRQRGLRQFVALTATVENAGDIAEWMECLLVSSSERDVPLHQEIWFEDTRFSKQLGIEGLVNSCNTCFGVEYESAIVDLLRQETAWNVRAVDDGGRQNVPDILIELGELQILVECKTCTKSPALVKKEEAWAVMQKAADFDSKMRRVTLGKPGFDETSKKKVAASHDITLVEHDVFIEGVLRVISGTLPPTDFLKWLGTPGLAEIQRLSGDPTYNQV